MLCTLENTGDLKMSENNDIRLKKTVANDAATLLLILQEKIFVDVEKGLPYYDKEFTKQIPVSTDDNGYIRMEYKGKKYRMHRIVLLYVSKDLPITPKIECNHIDGNKSNNSISNLEWVSRAENVAKAIKNGNWHIKSGRTLRALTNDQVLLLRKLNSDGWSRGELVRYFGVSYNTVATWLNPNKPLKARGGRKYLYKIKYFNNTFETTDLKEFCILKGLPYQSTITAFKSGIPYRNYRLLEKTKMTSKSKASKEEVN